MSRFSWFFAGVLVGAVGVYTSLHYHVVRTDEGVHLVPKVASTFSETYVDVRDYSVSDWSKHKTLLAAVVKAKKHDLLKDSGSDTLVEGMQHALDGLGISSDSL
jgi:hypothetical protein